MCVTCNSDNQSHKHTVTAHLTLRFASEVVMTQSITNMNQPPPHYGMANGDRLATEGVFML